MELKPEDVGRRLAQLRAELSKQSEENWTQERLARELNLAQSIIAKAEQGKGSLPNMIQILVFYKKQGFSIDWVLDEKPSQEFPVRTEQPQNQTNAENIKDALKKYIDKFKL